MTLAEAAERLRRAKAESDRAGRAVTDAETALAAMQGKHVQARYDLNVALNDLRDAAMGEATNGTTS